MVAACSFPSVTVARCRIDLGAKFANAVLQFGVRDFVAVLRGEASNGFLIFVASADAQRLPFLRSELQSRIDALLVAPIANVELFTVIYESEGLERAAFAIMAIVVDLRSFFLIGEESADVLRLRLDEAVPLDLSGVSIQSRLLLGRGLGARKNVARTAHEVILHGAFRQIVSKPRHGVGHVASGGVHRLGCSHGLILL